MNESYTETLVRELSAKAERLTERTEKTDARLDLVTRELTALIERLTHLDTTWERDPSRNLHLLAEYAESALARIEQVRRG